MADRAGAPAPADADAVEIDSATIDRVLDRCAVLEADLDATAADKAVIAAALRRARDERDAYAVAAGDARVEIDRLRDEVERVSYERDELRELAATIAGIDLRADLERAVKDRDDADRAADDLERKLVAALEQLERLQLDRIRGPIERLRRGVRVVRDGLAAWIDSAGVVSSIVDGDPLRGER